VFRVILLIAKLSATSKLSIMKMNQKSTEYLRNLLLQSKILFLYLSTYLLQFNCILGKKGTTMTK